MAHENPNDAPQAYSIQYYLCNACENLHVVLTDEDGLTIATAVVGKEMLDHMLGVVNGRGNGAKNQTSYPM